jgi:predicted ArsR family transcriptional regulator
VQEAAGHPIKAQIIAELSRKGSGGAAEIARRIEVPVRSVRHYLTKLVDEGLVEMSGSRPRRGTREKIYRVNALMRFESNAFEEMSADEARRITSELLRSIVADITGVLVAGTFDRPGSAGIRIEAEVDEAGWVEVADILQGAVGEIEAARSRAARRLRRSREEPGQSISIITWFERPTPDEPGRATEVVRSPRQPSPDLAPALQDAMAHPVKAKIVIGLAASRPLGVTQIAERIREPTRRVRYHVSRLLADGLLAETPTAGTTARRYSLVLVPRFDDEDMARLTPTQARHVWSEIFRRVVIEAAEAISAGTFFRRPDFLECRIPAAVDREGWAEIEGISRRAAEAAEAVRADAARRLDASGSEPILATAAILWLELPHP